MALPYDVDDEDAKRFRAREHGHGGRCKACAVTKCPLCGQLTLHRIAGEWVCENRCSPLARIESVWRAEMRAALARCRRRRRRA